MILKQLYSNAKKTIFITFICICPYTVGAVTPEEIEVFKEASKLTTPEDVTVVLDFLRNSDINASIPVSDDNCTALHYAVLKNNVDVVKALIDRGVWLNAQEDFREATPLLMATETKNWEIIKILLQAGASPYVEDTFQSSPKKFLMASREGIKLLREWDEKVRGIVYQPKTGEELSLALIERLRQPQEGPLDLLEIQEFMVDGLNVHTVDQWGRTPLMWAADKGMVELIKELLEHGANPVVTDQNNDTALILAARNNNKPIMAQLLSRSNFDMHAVNNDGDSAFIWASRWAYVTGKYDISKVNPDDVKIALLQLASKSFFQPSWEADSELIGFLLHILQQKKIADLTKFLSNDKGQTILMLAVEKYLEDARHNALNAIIKPQSFDVSLRLGKIGLLLLSGINVNQRDHGKVSCLEKAVIYQSYPHCKEDAGILIKLLEEMGASRKFWTIVNNLMSNASSLQRAVIQTSNAVEVIAEGTRDIGYAARQWGAQADRFAVATEEGARALTQTSYAAIQIGSAALQTSAAMHSIAQTCTEVAPDFARASLIQARAHQTQANALMVQSVCSGVSNVFSSACLGVSVLKTSSKVCNLLDQTTSQILPELKTAIHDIGSSGSSALTSLGGLFDSGSSICNQARDTLIPKIGNTIDSVTGVNKAIANTMPDLGTALQGIGHITNQVGDVMENVAPYAGELSRMAIITGYTNAASNAFKTLLKIFYWG